MIRQTELIIYGQIPFPLTAQTVSQVTASTRNAHYADLYPDESIPIKYSVADIKNINGRSSVYSKQIKIPGTHSNNNLFKQIFDINSDSSFDPNKKAACSVCVSSIEVLSGFIQLLSIDRNLSLGKNYIEYSVIVYGSNFDFFKSLGETELSDLNYSNLSYSFGKNEIKSSWTGNTDYVVPLIDFGFGWTEPDVQSTNPVKYNQMFPCLRVKAIWDRIFSSANTPYKYRSNFINSTFFKNLIISPTAQLVQADYVVNLTYSGTWSNTHTQQYVYVDFMRIRNNARLAIETQTFHFPADGSSTSFSGTATLQGTVEVLPGDTLYVDTRCDVADNSTKEFTSGNLTVYRGATWSMQYDNSNSNIYVGLTGDYTVSIPATNQGTTTVVFNNDSTFPFHDPGNTYNTSTGLHRPNVSFGNFLPQKFKCTDFITSLIQMFNLYIDVDKQNENVLIVEPRDQYYLLSDSVFDWTLKQDISHNQETKLLSELQNRNLNFSYKDDNDALNADYKLKTRQTYGSYTKTFDNDFLVNTQNIQPSFSPTPLQNLGANSEIIIPRIYSLSNDITPVESSTNFNARILYYGGLLPISNTSNRWTLKYSDDSTETLSSYPYCGNLDHPINPTNDLNYGRTGFVYFTIPNGTGFTINNLYTGYWKNYTEMIGDKNSKLLTAYFNLNPSDIARIKLNDKIFVDGNYYYINSIEYDALGKNTTKVELLKINKLNTIAADLDIVSFGVDLSMRDLHNRGTVTVTGIDNSIPFISSNTYVFGNSNTFLGSVSGATVMGSGNTISTGSRLMIQGNGNFIANGSFAISLLNSDDNNIGGG